jgi:hypothetical protein
MGAEAECRLPSMASPSSVAREHRRIAICTIQQRPPQGMRRCVARVARWTLLLFFSPHIALFSVSFSLFAPAKKSIDAIDAHRRVTGFARLISVSSATQERRSSTQIKAYGGWSPVRRRTKTGEAA